MKVLAVLQRMPREAAYRTHTQQIVQQRLQIVQAVRGDGVRGDCVSGCSANVGVSLPRRPVFPP